MEEVIDELGQEEVEEEDVRRGKYMTFQIGQDVFGIELKYVNEIIQMQPVTPIPEVEPFIKGLINLRGKIIPVIDVADRFGKEASPYNDRTCVIVIEVSGIEVGLIINSIAQVVSIEEQDILPPPNMAHGTAPQNKFVRGIGKMEDGVKLLLDPVKLLSDDALNFVDKQENEEEE
ncbi:MAG: chemotaxis protein CheW [Roseburia sp.]|jgi:purine-binding chemotaxis protein CheW|nr:purine-binding chemotaxis protein CheW [Roseburia sp.]MCI5612276.1 chemotaxis protein CheW [Roseburia sp.]